MRRKSQAAMEFLLTYGWAILVVLVTIAALAYFGVLSPPYLLTPSSPDNICNALMQTDETEEFIYPELLDMGNKLKELTNTDNIGFIKPFKAKSDEKVLKETNMVFCSVPTEVCYTETENGKVLYENGSFCIGWIMEVPVNYLEFKEWWEETKNVR